MSVKIYGTMWIICVFVIVFSPLSESIESSPNKGIRMRVSVRQMKADTLRLPSNATSIRENITDTFSCEDKSYGYYADIDNDCQIFHVCLPVTYADGKNQTFRWSFICPEETIFNQEVFVCVREEDSSINCEDSEDYYGLNDSFGDKEIEEGAESSEGESDPSENQMNDAQDQQQGDNNAQEMEAQDNKRRKKPTGSIDRGPQRKTNNRRRPNY